MRLLKYLWWDLKNPGYRVYYWNSLLSEVPGQFGREWRRRAVGRHFGKAGPGLRIHVGARFRGIEKLEVGANVDIGVDSFVQASGGVTMGDNVMLGPGVKIWSVNHRFEDATRPIYEQGMDLAPVTIGDNVWIGANAFIFPGVTIPEGCVVAACSVVGKKRYPPYTIIGGSPARVIGHRKRDEDKGDQDECEQDEREQDEREQDDKEQE